MSPTSNINDNGGDIMSPPSELMHSSIIYLFDKRAILNVAMLLRDSVIAKAIRYVILNVIDSPQGQSLMNQELQARLDELQRQNNLLNNLGTIKDQMLDEMSIKYIIALQKSAESIQALTNKLLLNGGILNEKEL